MRSTALLLVLAANAATVHTLYDAELAGRMVPLLSEVLRFPTTQKNPQAHDAQKAWLVKTAADLGLDARDAGPITEIELPGPPGAPVLGLAVHGDVQPVEESKWTLPPFAGEVKNGEVLGRGAADDKGPIVQALLAMKALERSGLPRTHTIRLLVGSDEESTNLDVKTYLQAHAAPAYTLVLDSEFPVVVGEKAWNAVTVATEIDARGRGKLYPYEVADISAGLSPSIVPDQAQIVLRWRAGDGGAARAVDWKPLAGRLAKKTLPPGTRLETKLDGDTLTVTARGKSAHGGVNLEGGRNALVALARALDGELPRGGADDLLAFARLAGQDLHGTGLGIGAADPLWGHYSVNVATIQKGPLIPPPTPGPEKPRERTLVVVTRRIPPLTGPELKTRLEKVVADFNARTGATLRSGGFYDDEVLAFDPNAKIVKRLMAAYERAAGKAERPAISGGGTYAKRIPNAIAFGMWFPGKPYPGHDVDEKIPVADLHRGAHVLIEALVDLATAPPIVEPFKP